MPKLLIIVLIYHCLAQSCHCYAKNNSEEEDMLREREVNDFYNGDSDYEGDKRSYETLGDENRTRESDGYDDVHDDFQRDAEVAENEEDDNGELINHFISKKEMTDVLYHRTKADPGNRIQFVSDSISHISF